MSRANPKRRYLPLIESGVNYAVARHEAGSLFRSTAGAVQFTLPDPGAIPDVVGAVYEFEMTTHTSEVHRPGAGPPIYYKGVAYTTVFLNTASDRVRLYCSSAARWDLLEYSGNPLLDTVPIETLDSSIVDVTATPYPLSDPNIKSLHVNLAVAGPSEITIQTALISVRGWRVDIKDLKLDAATNNIKIETQAAETIEGQPDAIINVDGGALTLQSDGTNLWVV